MKHSHKSQLGLDGLPVRTSEQAKAAIRKSDDAQNAVRNADADQAQRAAAEIFAEAMNDPTCGLTADEVAYLLGVSRSLVDKWCAPDAPNSPSFIQLLRLPLQFQFALNRALDRRFGYGRAALADAVAALGAIAVSLGR